MKNDNEESHESYGIVVITKPQSNVSIPLFGSSIRHRNLVRLTTPAGVGYSISSLRDFKCYANILVHVDSGYR